MLAGVISTTRLLAVLAFGITVGCGSSPSTTSGSDASPATDATLVAPDGPCAQPTTTDYFVQSGFDPARATGSQNCPFGSLSAAFAWFDTPPTRAVTIHVLSDLDAAGESFPLDVPPWVSVTGEKPDGSNVVLAMTTATDAFWLDNDHSALANVTIEGQVAAGVTVEANDVTVSHVRVDLSSSQNGGNAIGFLLPPPAPMQVAAAFDNITAIGNGLSYGFVMTLQSLAQIKGVSTFDHHAYGFDLNDQCALTINETSGASPWASPAVSVTRSTVSGVSIEATGANSITGLVVSNGAGNGFEIVAGSVVRLRDCVSVGNAQNGVVVEATGSLAGIDLGTTSSAGGNTFQVVDSASVHANGGAGLCVDTSSSPQQTLAAYGNSWVSTAAANVSCLSSAAKLTSSSDCVSAAGTTPLSIGFSGTDTANVGTCALP
jgi:hypothetical protein